MYKFLANKIYIIDSVPDGEGNSAHRLFEDINTWLSTCSTKFTIDYCKIALADEFKKKLISIENDIINNQIIPIIHIEGHSDKEFFSVSDDEKIEWTSVFEYFRNINIKTQNNLLVTLGTCQSAYSYNASIITRECPVYGLVAPIVNVSLKEVEETYSLFYQNLLIENDFTKAINDLNVQCDSEKFNIIISEFIFRKAALAYLKNHCRRKSKQKRIEALITKGRRKTRMPLKKIRRFLKRTFRDDSAIHLNKFYKHFLMIDKYPELKKRYSIDLKKIVAESKKI